MEMSLFLNSVLLPTRGDHFRFGSVFIKKSNQTKFFFEKKPKPNRNRVKPTCFGAVRFLGQKPVWLGFSGFGSIFFNLARFWLGFSGLARFWLCLARFFFGFLSVSVRFGFLRFVAYKTETELNRPVF
jgi:hypothetical protein